MPRHSLAYTLRFSTAVCGVCAVVVSSLAVALKADQEANELLYKQRNVLQAAGLLDPASPIPDAEVVALFAQIEAAVVDLESGTEVSDVDVDTFDQQAEKKDPKTSEVAPQNNAGVKRVPNRAQVFKKVDASGNVEMLVLPIEGYGLWSTLYGFIALSGDLGTIQGITFYQHGETPGLGGEVDNPRWKGLWPDRKAFDEAWEPKIEVIKGAAGPPSEDPYAVDGLSGATITARGVTNMLHFWLGPEGFGPYLKNFREGGVA